MLAFHFIRARWLGSTAPPPSRAARAPSAARPTRPWRAPPTRAAYGAGRCSSRCARAGPGQGARLCCGGASPLRRRHRPAGARSITGEDQESTTLAALARTTAAAVPHRQAGGNRPGQTRSGVWSRRQRDGVQQPPGRDR
ncbi:hypothetical protein PR202_ga18728 [Eleusine coracana subsp. coracana]|uniref:Uncharacterized protein n=1 Tax=Eleusine coracana subsp. coracana TaxID=191504 RepID=A0AAV5CTQ5_ELECO|nr:hypothetical protein PR202_ga18728 [Eleusine coracana subsp. coracana]